MPSDLRWNSFPNTILKVILSSEYVGKPLPVLRKFLLVRYSEVEVFRGIETDVSQETSDVPYLVLKYVKNATCSTLSLSIGSFVTKVSDTQKIANAAKLNNFTQV